MDQDDGRRPAVSLDGSAHDGPRAEVSVEPKTRARWTRAIEDIFFAELARTANVRHSARVVGLTDRGARLRRKANPDFAARWMAALEEGYAALELQMLRHALEGVERTETVRDAEGAIKQVKTVHSFPHGATMWLLQRHRESVERHRLAEAMRGADDDPAIIERVRTELVRVRLLRSHDGQKEEGASD